MARVLFTSGPVITFDGRPATALAVDGDRIVAVGDETIGWSACFDQVVQLDGLPLLPAFRDGHARPPHGGINRNVLDLPHDQWWPFPARERWSQFIGRPRSDGDLLRLAAACEPTLPWTGTQP